MMDGTLNSGVSDAVQEGQPDQVELAQAPAPQNPPANGEQPVGAAPDGEQPQSPGEPSSQPPASPTPAQSAVPNPPAQQPDVPGQGQPSGIANQGAPGNGLGLGGPNGLGGDSGTPSTGGSATGSTGGAGQSSPSPFSFGGGFNGYANPNGNASSGYMTVSDEVSNNDVDFSTDSLLSMSIPDPSDIVSNGGSMIVAGENRNVGEYFGDRDPLAGAGAQSGFEETSLTDGLMGLGSGSDVDQAINDIFELISNIFDDNNEGEAEPVEDQVEQTEKSTTTPTTSTAQISDLEQVTAGNPITKTLKGSPVSLVGTTGDDNWNACIKPAGGDLTSGSVTVCGGDGDDTLNVTLCAAGQIDDACVTVEGNNGNDTICLIFRGYCVDDAIAKVDGGAGNDTIRVEVNATCCDITNTLDLTLCGGTGTDSICLGLHPGDDIYTGCYSLLGGAGNDTLCVHACNAGDDGDERICNNDAYFDGGAGNDTIIGQWCAKQSSIDHGCITALGGSGCDTICFTHCFGFAGNGDGCMCGNSIVMNGGASNDTLCLHVQTTCPCCSVAFACNETQMLGDAGNDTINFQFCASNFNGGAFCRNELTMCGGNGNDIICANYTVNNCLDSICCNSTTLSGDGGNDTICLILDLCVEDVDCRNCYCLLGGSGTDTLHLFATVDGYKSSKNCYWFDGGVNGDNICIDVRADGASFCSNQLIIVGGAGNDTIVYNAQDIGNASADYSKLNKISITGGAGADTICIACFDTNASNCFCFMYTATSEGGDTISGFTDNTDFNFFFSRAAFSGDAGADGNLDAGMFVSGAGAVSGDADDYWIYDTTDGKLYYDVGGNAGAARVEIADFNANVALASANINFVA